MWWRGSGGHFCHIWLIDPNPGCHLAKLWAQPKICFNSRASHSPQQNGCSCWKDDKPACERSRDFLALQHQLVSLCVVGVMHSSWRESVVKVCVCVHACVTERFCVGVCEQSDKEFGDPLPPPFFPCVTILLVRPWPNNCLCVWFLVVCVCVWCVWPDWTDEWWIKDSRE